MKTLTASQLKQSLDGGEDFVLINVLDQDQFERAHIEGSHHVPVHRRHFAREVERLAGGKGRKIVVYCASFQCDASRLAAKKLDSAGFASVYDFEGGIADWIDAGFEIRSGVAVSRRNPERRDSGESYWSG
jgi:rhodanese-related sulfurtransferase